MRNETTRESRVSRGDAGRDVLLDLTTIYVKGS